MGILREPSRGRMKLSTELLVFGMFAVTICTAFPANKNVADNSKVLDLVNSREPHLTLWENVPIEDTGYPYPTPPTYVGDTTTTERYPYPTPPTYVGDTTTEDNAYPYPTPSYAGPETTQDDGYYPK